MPTSRRVSISLRCFRNEPSNSRPTVPEDPDSKRKSILSTCCRHAAEIPSQRKWNGVSQTCTASRDSKANLSCDWLDLRELWPITNTCCDKLLLLRIHIDNAATLLIRLTQINSSKLVPVCPRSIAVTVLTKKIDDLMVAWIIKNPGPKWTEEMTWTQPIWK